MTKLNDLAKRSLGRRVFGQIKCFDKEKRFGFIVTPNVIDDLFFHISGVDRGSRGRILSGSECVFTLIETDRGLRADRVVIN